MRNARSGLIFDPMKCFELMNYNVTRARPIMDSDAQDLVCDYDRLLFSAEF